MPLHWCLWRKEGGSLLLHVLILQDGGEVGDGAAIYFRLGHRLLEWGREGGTSAMVVV